MIFAHRCKCLDEWFPTFVKNPNTCGSLLEKMGFQNTLYKHLYQLKGEAQKKVLLVSSAKFRSDFG